MQSISSIEYQQSIKVYLYFFFFFNPCFLLIISSKNFMKWAYTAEFPGRQLAYYGNSSERK